MPTQWLTWIINGKAAKVLKLFLQKWHSLIFFESSLKMKHRLTVKVGLSFLKELYLEQHIKKANRFQVFRS